MVHRRMAVDSRPATVPPGHREAGDRSRPTTKLMLVLAALSCVAAPAGRAAAMETASPPTLAAEPAKPSEAADAAPKSAEGASHPEGAKPVAGAAAEAVKSAEAGKPTDLLPTPYTAMRNLQRLQDQVARGNLAAQSAQPKMLDHIAEVFVATEPSQWREPRNAYAAALYLFSAGRPTVMRAVLDHATFTPDGDRLVKGALAYAEGQDEIARQLLAKFNPRAIPPGIGGHLALVMATLLATKDPAKAQTMLDTARLLAPGTLVEEAALRRQIFSLADDASLEKFVALSCQYIRRYRLSVFASNFKGRLTSFALRIAVEDDVARLAKLDPVLAELPPPDRRTLYLGLARAALVAGRSESAQYASARAAALSPDPAQAERARLYSAAAAVTGDGAAKASAALRSIDDGRLPARDAALRDAALAVASSVDTALGDRGGDLGAEMPASDTPAGALIDRAHRALASTDALLGDTGTATRAVNGAKAPAMAQATSQRAAP